MRRAMVALIMAGLLVLAAVAPAFAIVHPGVPICNAIDATGNSNPGGGPAAPLPGQASSGAGGPGQVAQGAVHSGDNSPDAPDKDPPPCD